MSRSLEKLLREIRDCRHCEKHLPLGPNPIVRAHSDARVLLVGQAPGTRVHESSQPWNDPSGDRLRDWLGVDHDQFYDERNFAIVPMGFCYPGKGKSGDLPPRKECAELWREPIHAELPNIELTLLIGQYAQAYYLGKRKKKTLTETVRCWEEFFPEFIPTPHPSPRNFHWLQKNAWFESELVPHMRQKVHELLAVESDHAR